MGLLFLVNFLNNSCTFLQVLVFCCAGVAVIIYPLHLLPYLGMARTRGGYNFKPRVRRSSPPPATGHSSPPTTTPMLPFLLLLYIARTTRGLGLLYHLLPIRVHQRGPGHWTRASHLPQGHRSPIRHMSRGQLMTFPRISPLLLSFGAPSFIAAPLQAIQIVVLEQCTARHIMIFQLLLQIPSSGIP